MRFSELCRFLSEAAARLYETLREYYEPRKLIEKKYAEIRMSPVKAFDYGESLILTIKNLESALAALGIPLRCLRPS